MIIDLSIPRLFVMDKINEVIFDAKMKGYRLNRHQLTAIFTTAMILGYNNRVLAYQGTIDINEGLKLNIYGIIFALIESLKSCTYDELKNMGIYFSYALLKRK